MKLIIQIRRDERGYRAWCPALPGCTVRAETPQEAQKKIELAAKGYIASMHAEVTLTGPVMVGA